MTLKLGQINCRSCGMVFFIYFKNDVNSIIWNCRCPACGIRMTKTVEFKEYQKIEGVSLSEAQKGEADGRSL